MRLTRVGFVQWVCVCVCVWGDGGGGGCQNERKSMVCRCCSQISESSHVIKCMICRCTGASVNIQKTVYYKKPLTQYLYSIFLLLTHKTFLCMPMWKDQSCIAHILSHTGNNPSWFLVHQKAKLWFWYIYFCYCRRHPSVAPIVHMLHIGEFTRVPTVLDCRRPSSETNTICPCWLNSLISITRVICQSPQEVLGLCVTASSNVCFEGTATKCRVSLTMHFCF